jgi:steroid delta-isomerase
MTTDPRAQALVTLFEHFKPADVAGLGRLYDAQAFFKDPFNEVHGLPAIQAIFDHMFQSLAAPRFKVLDVLVDGRQCFLSWDFEFGLRGRPGQPQRIHGSSHLRFGADGRVVYHRDYWDAAEELYEKLPLLGGLLRLIKRRLRA